MVLRYNKKFNKDVKIKILNKKYLNFKYLSWLKDNNITYYTDQYKSYQSLKK